MTTAEITKAFRQQSLLVHPDKNSDPKAEEGFKKLQAAYAALKEEGNEHFRNKRYAPALECYEAAVGAFRYAKQLDPDWKNKGIKDETIDLIDDRGDEGSAMRAEIERAVAAEIVKGEGEGEGEGVDVEASRAALRGKAVANTNKKKKRRTK